MQRSTKPDKGLLPFTKKVPFTNENTIYGATGLKHVDEMDDEEEEEDENESETDSSDIDNNIDNTNDAEEEDVEDQSDFGDNYRRVIYGSKVNI